MSASRRTFVKAGVVAIVSLALPLRSARANRSTPHPKPRAGITGAKVLTRAQLSEKPELIPLFDAVRKIPHVVDGIRCNCNCGNPPEYYSLLSCYEGVGMARDCAVCQGQGKLAVRLHGEGKSLAAIRVAIDAKFG